MANSRIHLSFRHSPASPERRDSRLLETAILEDLSYKYFLGDIHFVIGGAEFNADWDWVPILDFAICLRAIAKCLRESAHEETETFEFTESEAAIKFEKIDEEVEVTTNYATGRERVPMRKLDEAIREFATNVYRDLVASIVDMPPDLKSVFNSCFLKLPYFQRFLGSQNRLGTTNRPG